MSSVQDVLSLRNLLFLSGLLHFFQPLSMLIAPKMLGMTDDMARLSPINRAIFVVLIRTFMLTVVGTGAVVALGARELAAGGRLAAALCGFLFIFFSSRAFVQLRVYAPHWPKTPYGRLSHYGLTGLFLFHVGVYLAGFVNACK